MGFTPKRMRNISGHVHARIKDIRMSNNPSIYTTFQGVAFRQRNISSRNWI